MFVDRVSSPPVVTFTYVDAGAVTLEAFGTHLRAYLGLFQELPKLEFIYLAPIARLFQAAESEFYHVLLWSARPRQIREPFALLSTAQGSGGKGTCGER
jgi:hypothetical protein